MLRATHVPRYAIGRGGFSFSHWGTLEVPATEAQAIMACPCLAKGE